MTNEDMDPLDLLPCDLQTSLKPHQKHGIRFLWSKVYREGGGGILAHGMGLGKTLQILSFIYALHQDLAKNSTLQTIILPKNPLLLCPLKKKSNNGALSVLILCPPMVTKTWEREWLRWFTAYNSPDESIPASQDPSKKQKCQSSPSADGPFKRHQLPFSSSPLPRNKKNLSLGLRVVHSGLDPTLTTSYIERWKRDGGILVCGYAFLRSLCGQSERCHRNLLLHPYLIVADEGHVLKNAKGQLGRLLAQVGTARRIVLTGYPVQNNLLEYWNMLEWIRPGALYSHYHSNSNEINKDDEGDMIDRQIAGGLGDDVAGHRAWWFAKEFEGPIRRGMYADARALDRSIATQKMCVLQQLASSYIHRQSQPSDDESKKMEGDGNLQGSNRLPPKHDFVLQVKLSRMQRTVYEQLLTGKLFMGNNGANLSTATDFLERASLLTRICAHPATLLTDLPTCESNDREEEGPEGSNRSLCRCRKHNPAYWDVKWSPKMQIALSLVKGAVLERGEAVLIFSRSLSTLDYFQGVVEQENIVCRRLDGATPRITREQILLDFQSTNTIDQEPDEPASKRCMVLLVSIMTGSLGIALTRASRIIMLDIGWNPCHDEQAIARAHRPGQLKPVFVYRLYGGGSLECRLYRYNVHKSAMVEAMLDGRQDRLGKHWSSGDGGKHLLHGKANNQSDNAKKSRSTVSFYCATSIFIEEDADGNALDDFVTFCSDDADTVNLCKGRGLSLRVSEDSLLEQVLTEHHDLVETWFEHDPQKFAQCNMSFSAFVNKPKKPFVAEEVEKRRAGPALSYHATIDTLFGLFDDNNHHNIDDTKSPSVKNHSTDTLDTTVDPTTVDVGSSACSLNYNIVEPSSIFPTPFNKRRV